MLRAPVLVAACAVVLLAAARAPAAEARVAILPIVVHTLEEPDYLKAGLADMLASRLGRAAGVAVVRAEGEEAATTDAETARRAGRELGADYVLFGSFTRFGEGASLDVRCLRVGAEEASDARSVFIQSGTLAEVIPQLDVLAEKVARYVRDGAGPAVAAGSEEPSSAAGAGTGDELQAVRAELSALRERVQVLEEQLAPGAPAAGTAGSAGEDASQEPELASELR